MLSGWSNRMYGKKKPRLSIKRMANPKQKQCQFKIVRLNTSKGM